MQVTLANIIPSILLLFITSTIAIIMCTVTTNKVLIPCTLINLKHLNSFKENGILADKLIIIVKTVISYKNL